MKKKRRRTMKEKFSVYSLVRSKKQRVGKQDITERQLYFWRRM